ncbi:MAG: YncE family protein [Thermoplasmata archaeon]
MALAVVAITVVMLLPSVSTQLTDKLSVSTASATPASLTAPYVAGAAAAIQQSSVTLTSPGALNIFLEANGGHRGTTQFSSGTLAVARDQMGHISAAIAATQDSSDSYTTADHYYSIAGVGVSGFQYYGEKTQVSTPPVQPSTTLRDTFVLRESALVVVVAASGGQDSILLAGIPGLALDANGTGGTWSGVMVGHAHLTAGTYTVTETSTNHDAGGTNRADALGLFAFANKKAGFIDMRLAAIRIVATIPVGTGPQGMAYDSAKGEVFVWNALSSNVSVIDDATNEIVATIPVGSSTGQEFGYNEALAYDNAKGEIFVTNEVSNNVSVISDATNKVVATIAVGTNPVGVAYDPRSGEIFVADMYYAGGDSAAGKVSVINDTTDKVVANISVSGGPWEMVYDNAKNELFLDVRYGDGGLGSFVVISCATNTVITPQLRAGDYPAAVTYDGALGEVFIANSGNYPADATVDVVNDTSNSVVATVLLDLSAKGAAYDSATEQVFVAGDSSPTSTLYVISPTTNAVVETLAVGNDANSVTYDSGQQEIFISNFATDMVTVVSVPTS